MPKPVPADSLDRLLSLLATQSQGIGIDALARAFLPPVPRRTLQRWLARLVAARKVEPVGSARALRYRCASYASKAPARVFNLAEPGADSMGANIPVSSEGEEVRTYVRRPREQRRPASYTIAFLEQYHPNRTHYLPDALRRQLHQMGRSSAQGAAAGTFARDILSRLLIDLSWASSRLEGNTYSLLDTERLFRFGHAADGKDALETQMILNHKAAIEYLVLDPPHAVVSARTIIALHALLSDGLMADPRMSGRLRSRPVGIGGSTYMPLAIPQKIEELFGITVGMAAEITDPFEQAFFLMVHLPYLQPFEDVNKRVSRLAANIPLIRHNLSPLSFIDMPVQTYTESMLGVYDRCGKSRAPRLRRRAPR